jgi:hypothetical protein
MEETENKGLPFSFNKRLGDVGVPVLGVIVLLEIALLFPRPAHEVNRLSLIVIALITVDIGAAYYAFTRRLGSLREKIDEKNLGPLYLYTSNLAIFAYVMCILTLGLVH